MDLKPQNLLVSHGAKGGAAGAVLKLADFGIAQVLRKDESSTAARGTPLYLAPEMVRAPAGRRQPRGRPWARGDSAPNHCRRLALFCQAW